MEIHTVTPGVAAGLLLCLLGAAAARLDAQETLRFGVIGDYGLAGQPEADVAAMLTGWGPDIIVTTGDNNYESGAASTIDQNIGQYYSAYIFPYAGSYGAGDTVNRFFPVPGNHDWITPNAQPYLDYFTLPGNERYYDFVRGPVHFFMIDSDPHEPDGIDSASVQALWLKERLAESASPWKIVSMHHAPYSSCSRHGSQTVMQWPYARWGATAVLSGHDHTYERIIRDGTRYFVNGLGGKGIYSFGAPVEGSVVRFNGDHGAMVVDADPATIRFRFVTRTGTVADDYTVSAEYQALSPVPVEAGWNLVSLPLSPPARTVQEIFPTALGAAYTFNGASYLPVDTLVAGRGYWLKFPSAETAVVEGAPRPSETVAVSAGWNLLGPSSRPAPVTDIVGSGTTILSSFFGYDGTYAVADTLQPGRGYWVKVDGPGSVIIGGSR